MTRKFVVHFEGDAEIILDDRVIDTVDDEWREHLYQSLVTPDDIAAHVGYNLVINNITLSHMDGWADMPDNFARVTSGPDWEVSAEETT